MHNKKQAIKISMRNETAMIVLGKVSQNTLGFGGGRWEKLNVPRFPKE